MPTTPAGQLPTLEKMLDGIDDVVPVNMPDADNALRDGPRFPFIVVRAAPWSCVIRPIVCKDHLSIDLHPFVNGEPASVGMAGMTYGRMHLPANHTGQTSHGWQSMDLGVAVIGAQG